MSDSIGHALSGVTLLATLLGIVYLTFALLRVRAYRRRRDPSPAEPMRAVTVLKPVCGVDPGLYENLCSFCEQDYPAFQVIFGVRDGDDPAIPIIERVIARYPERELELVIDGRVRATNLKVANLANMAERARHEILVIADADMRVDRSYLRSVVSSFGPGVGAVTCLYNGTPARTTFASVLGAMFINEQFAPAVLVALALQQLRFCFGATMAVTRPALAAIGGIEALASHIADDHMLGKLVSERGFTVALSPYVVENLIFDPGLATLWGRELRWARTIRSLRPVGYAFSFITYAVPMALLFLAISRDVAWGCGALAVALGLRVGLNREAHRTFGAPRAAPWLIPVRDLLSFTVWAAGFLGRGVRWRGWEFALKRDGSVRSTS